MPTEINYNSILQKHIQNNHPLAQQANPAGLLPQASSNPAIGAMKEAVGLATKEKDKEIDRLKTLFEDLWDQSEYVDTDIDSLQWFAGKSVLTKESFDKFKQTHNL